MRFHIYFSGYTEVEANGEEEAREKASDKIKGFAFVSIDGIEMIDQTPMKEEKKVIGKKENEPVQIDWTAISTKKE